MTRDPVLSSDGNRKSEYRSRRFPRSLLGRPPRRVLGEDLRSVLRQGKSPLAPPPPPATFDVSGNSSARGNASCFLKRNFPSDSIRSASRSRPCDRRNLCPSRKVNSRNAAGGRFPGKVRASPRQEYHRGGREGERVGAEGVRSLQGFSYEVHSRD
jgi:hypothetical protein